MGANLYFMATPPNRSTANSDATANLDAIHTADDAAFIQGAGDSMLDAISLGLFQVCLTTTPGCSPQALHDYFVALGYAVSYPGLGMAPGSTPSQPAELFGIFWDMFWQNQTPMLPDPVRMQISWK